MLKKLILLLLGIIYAASYWYAYVYYIHPTFEYAHYNLNSLDVLASVGCLIISVFPLIFYRQSESPAGFASALLYCITYIPGIFTIFFNWEHARIPVAIILLVLAGCMCIIFVVSSLRWSASMSNRRISAIQLLVVHGLYITSLVVLVAIFGQHMRLVDFQDVYELRFETNMLVTSRIFHYLLSWQTYVCLPFYYAYAVVNRKYSYFIYGLVGSVLIYLATGAKSVVFMPVIVVALYAFIYNSNYLFHKLLLGLSLLVVLATAVFPDDGVFLWLKSILLLRVLATNGWVLSKYYDYFAENGFTYYSHIGIVNSLTEQYSYGHFSLGELIGIEYSGSELANFNANFWASDGLAALGVYGLLVATAAFCIVLISLNYAARNYSSRFVILWLAGFWIALLNLPLSTALFSGGGLIIMILLLLPKLTYSSRIER